MYNYEQLEMLEKVFGKDTAIVCKVWLHRTKQMYPLEQMRFLSKATDKLGKMELEKMMVSTVVRLNKDKKPKQRELEAYLEAWIHNRLGSDDNLGPDIEDF
jgi:hypothetical protein